MKNFLFLVTLSLLVSSAGAFAFSNRCVTKGDLNYLKENPAIVFESEELVQICVNYSVSIDEINNLLISHFPNVKFVQFTFHHHYLGTMKDMAPAFKYIPSLEEVRGDYFPEPKPVIGEKWPEHDLNILKDQVFTRADYERYLQEQYYTNPNYGCHF